jgi:hypothetical protein
MGLAHPVRETWLLWYRGLLLTVLLLIAYLYRLTFAWWWTEWTTVGSWYAHVVILPFFVGLLVHRSRTRLAAIHRQTAWSGLIPLLLSMLVLLLAQQSEVMVMTSFSFSLLLLGSALLLFGTAWTRLQLFPLLLITMMLPLVPGQLINRILFPL